MRAVLAISLVFTGLTFLSGCNAVKDSGGQPPPPPPQETLTVNLAGTGTGTVTSTPAGMNCTTGSCSATFQQGTAITLAAAPAQNSTFGGWSGACSGIGACRLTLSANQSVTATFTKSSPGGDITSINHIIIMSQENRSFDHYFGHLMDYWVKNNYPQATNGTTLDGEPSTNPVPGSCTGAADFCNVGNPPASGLASAILPIYHARSMCIENPSPSWDESHTDFNWHANWSGSIPPAYLGDGFAHTAGQEGPVTPSSPPPIDVAGSRVMGYYTGDDLNYYYFMASNFGTSDRWFSPIMSRTQPNRMYMLAGTSAGHTYPLHGPSKGNPGDKPLAVKTIFEALDANSISYKIYVHPTSQKPGQPPPCTTAPCLFGQSYINMFQYGGTILHTHPERIVTTDQFILDAQNGTLPQVAYIDPPSESSLDEHPSDSTQFPVQIQAGAKFVASLINSVMSGLSWKDSAFIFTFDEAGGLFDHVSPQVKGINDPGSIAVSPDNIAPIDLRPGDKCLVPDGTPTGHPNTSLAACNFEATGYRLPLIVISPFAKKNYVSHTPMDYTAMLKLIETRFGLPPLTARDAAQPDMTEFFDFVNVPWATPPTPPTQVTNGPCFFPNIAIGPPAPITVIAGQSQQFTVTANDPPMLNSVSWYVDNILNGNATVGTITDSGFYTAPQLVTVPETHKITVLSNSSTPVASSEDITVSP